MAKQSNVEQLLALIDQVGESELAEFDARIAALEKELDAIRQARRLIAAKLGITPPPKPKPAKSCESNGQPARRSAPGGGPTLAEKVLRHIATNGPDRITGLAEKLGVNYQSVHSAVSDSRSPWFDKQSDGVHLTAAGVQAAKELK